MNSWKFSLACFEKYLFTHLARSEDKCVWQDCNVLKIIINTPLTDYHSSRFCWGTDTVVISSIGQTNHISITNTCRCLLWRLLQLCTYISLSLVCYMSVLGTSQLWTSISLSLICYKHKQMYVVGTSPLVQIYYTESYLLQHKHMSVVGNSLYSAKLISSIWQTLITFCDLR